MTKTCMGSYKMSKYKREIGEEEMREEIGICLGSFWLIKGESWLLKCWIRAVSFAGVVLYLVREYFVIVKCSL